MESRAINGCQLISNVFRRVRAYTLEKALANDRSINRTFADKSARRSGLTCGAADLKHIPALSLSLSSETEYIFRSLRPLPIDGQNVRRDLSRLYSRGILIRDLINGSAARNFLRGKIDLGFVEELVIKQF